MLIHKNAVKIVALGYWYEATHYLGQEKWFLYRSPEMAKGYRLAYDEDSDRFKFEKDGAPSSRTATGLTDFRALQDEIKQTKQYGVFL